MLEDQPNVGQESNTVNVQRYLNNVKHRNDTLYNNQHTGVSYKRQKTILRAVKTQLRIEFHHIRHRDRQSICSDYKVLKKWTTQILEAWLKNVEVLRDKALSKDAHGDNEMDDIPIDDMYIERPENLKRFSIPKFHRW